MIQWSDSSSVRCGLPALGSQPCGHLPALPPLCWTAPGSSSLNLSSLTLASRVFLEHAKRLATVDTHLWPQCPPLSLTVTSADTGLSTPCPFFFTIHGALLDFIYSLSLLLLGWGSLTRDFLFTDKRLLGHLSGQVTAHWRAGESCTQYNPAPLVT